MVTGSLKVLIPVSEELARRVPNLGELLLSAAAEEIAVRTDDAVINGVVGGPAGILPDAATIPVTKETNQTAGTIIPENVVKMIRRLWTYSDSRATFFASRSAQLEVLTNCASLIRFADPNDPGPARMSLAGIPLLPIEQCPAVGTKGDLILADCSQYALGDRGETKSAEIIYVRFENHERMLKFWYECDGRSIWKDPVSPLRDGTDTLSPFIVLEDRS
jgi:HK97 family phage major capsid protein